MRVVAEAAVELDQRLVHERVPPDLALEARLLARVGQLAVEEQEGGVEEVAARGHFFDRVAAVQEDPLGAVDEGDGRGAGGCNFSLGSGR